MEDSESEPYSLGYPFRVSLIASWYNILTAKLVIGDLIKFRKESLAPLLSADDSTVF
jgi:hypothetical protein